MEVFEIGSYKVTWAESGQTANGHTRVTLNITNQLSNESIAHLASLVPDGGLAYAGSVRALKTINDVPNVGTKFTITMTVP